MRDGFYFVNSDGTYAKFAATRTRSTKYPQNPIKPDELQFKADLRTIMPPYAEIVFVVSGVQVFHGIVTDRGSGLDSWDCKCKSMQWLLQYRYIPDYVYKGKNLNTVMASGLPTAGTTTVMGVLFLLQSIIPNGKWVYYNATTAKLVGGGSGSAIGSAALYASTNCPLAVAGDGAEGTKALAAGSSAAALTANQYYRSAADLYVRFGPGTYQPNAFLVAAAYWCDAKIRLGTIDIGTKICTVDQSLEGKASDSLSEFQEKIGREAQFICHNDGYLYYSLDDELSRGGATAPLRKFVHNLNAIITITPKTEPDIQVAIGLNDDDPPVAVSDWSIQEPQIFKTYDGKGELREELQAELQALVDENADSYKAVLPYEDDFLRIGDWVSLYKEQEYVLRIKKIDIQPGQTTLDCGKKLFDATEKFGELLRPTVDPSAEPIQVKTITAGSGSFVAKATNVAAGGWKCYFEESYTSDKDDSALSQNPFMMLKVNNRIIPPGRVAINGGSVKIDITEYCTKSATANKTNKIVRTMYNSTGWTSSTCEVKQYKGRAYL